MKRANPWLPAAVGVFAFLAFLPALNNGLVNWDDHAVLVDITVYQKLSLENLRLMLTTFLRGDFQPVTWLSYSLDYILWGARPFGFHLTNLLLHAANACLFYFVGLELLGLSSDWRGDSSRRELAAAIAALLFAVHPLRVESVAWATQRRDVLSCFFYLITIGLYLRAQREAAASRAALMRTALAAYVLCVFSKALGMILPPALLVLDVYPLKRLPADPRKWLASEHRGALTEKLPFFALATAAGALEAAAQTSYGTVIDLSRYGPVARTAQAAYSIVFYLWKTLIPANLSPLYEKSVLLEPGLFLFCGAAVAALSVLAYRLRRRWPALAAVWVYYLIAILPTAGLVKSGRQIAADRFSYLSCMGWAILAGAALARGRRSAAVAGAIIITLSFLTWRQTFVWRDSISLWSRVAAAAPENYFGRYNLAAALREAGRADEAAAEQQAAGEAHVAVLLKAGNLLNGRKEYGRAAPYFERALQLMPGLPPAREGLDTALRNAKAEPGN